MICIHATWTSRQASFLGITNAFYCNFELSRHFINVCRGNATHYSAISLHSRSIWSLTSKCGTLYSDMELIGNHIGDIAPSESASTFPCRFDGESARGILLIASWSRWSRAPSVQQGRRHLPRGTCAICSDPPLSSHITPTL